uniref:Uncharacterized protein n=1 Tax=Oryza nivara TaxID=4536 RepID=A0A0E0GEC5_ORYNI
KYLASARALEPSPGPNPRRPKTLFRYFPTHPSPPRGIITFFFSFSKRPSNPSPLPSPSQFDAAAVAIRIAPPSSPPPPPHPHGRLRRIRQCLRWRRRRRVRVLLLLPARHPEERVRHRRARRLPEARHEVAPGPVRERPRRGQSAVPADPRGVLRSVRQGEASHVRRRAVRSPRRRRPGFLRFHAGDAGDDG